MDGVALAAGGGAAETVAGASPRDEPLPATTFGEQALDGFYTVFGELVFDHWRRPSNAEYHAAIRTTLTRVGLPGDLEEAKESEKYNEALRRSHNTRVRPPVFT